MYALCAWGAAAELVFNQGQFVLPKLATQNFWKIIFQFGIRPSDKSFNLVIRKSISVVGSIKSYFNVDLMNNELQIKLSIL